MKALITIHGFNVRDKGKKTVQRMHPLFSSIFRVMNFTYGWLGLFGVLLKNKGIGKDLKRLADKQSVLANIIAHSNGAAVVVEALKQGAKFDTVLFINAALKVKTKFPAGVKHIVVIYTNHDVPTRAARFFDRIPIISIFVPNSWGAMGAEGYKGNDPRVININLTDVLDEHSDLFDKANLDSLSTLLVDIMIDPTFYS